MIFALVEFGKAVRKKRSVDDNVDLEKASLKIGVSKSTLSRIERGFVPDLKTFCKVCTWLKCDANTFFTDKRNK